MKNKWLFFGSILVALTILVIVGIVSYNSGYTRGYREGFSKVSESCVVDTDCKTPANYLIRSSCPFESKCIENRCNVVCTGPYKTKEDELNKTPQCNKNTDCNCKSFYAGNDIINCSCLNGLCTAIVSE
ncbi:hypothetical protein ISS42_01930 [Candidatus Shapirobacteria bacterium]|nr:hypothetical protein [Candidatus Shapirobacteria bacterium]